MCPHMKSLAHTHALATHTCMHSWTRARGHTRTCTHTQMCRHARKHLHAHTLCNRFPAYCAYWQESLSVCLGAFGWEGRNTPYCKLLTMHVALSTSRLQVESTSSPRLRRCVARMIWGGGCEWLAVGSSTYKMFGSRRVCFCFYRLVLANQVLQHSCDFATCCKGLWQAMDTHL